jgi:hypothetical protein
LQDKNFSSFDRQKDKKFLDNIPALKSAKEVFFSNVVKPEKQRKVKPYISSVKM